MLNTRQLLLRPTPLLFLLPIILLSSGCGGGSSGNTGVINPDPVVTASQTTSLPGAAVKGPLAFAEVRLHALDVLTEDFFDPSRVVANGTTTASAQFADIRIPQTASFPLVLVIDGSRALDLSTGRAPVITTLINIVTADMVETGRGVYATPLTTLAFRLARRMPGAHTSKEAFLHALENAADTIQDKLGFGMDPNIDILRDPPLLTNNTTSPKQQQQILEHRAALETVAAIANLVVHNSSNTSVTFDNTLERFAADLANDGILNGQAIDGSLGYSNTLSSITNPGALTLPNTNVRITDIKKIVETEVKLTGATTTLSAEVNDIVFPPLFFPDLNGQTTTTSTSSTSTSTSSSTSSTRSSTTTTRTTTTTVAATTTTHASTTTTLSSSTTRSTTTSTNSSSSNTQTSTTTAKTTTSTVAATTTTTRVSTTTTRSSSTTSSTTTHSTVSSTTTTTASSPPPTEEKNPLLGKLHLADDPVDWQQLVATATGTVYVVGSASEFNSRTAAARPGDVILIRAGKYNGWKLTVPSRGTTDAPITIAPQVSGTVTFTGSTKIKITGSHNIIGGFTLKDVDTTAAIAFDRATNNRFTDVTFLNCGNTDKSRIIELRDKSDNNRVDHNSMVANKSFGIVIGLPVDGDTSFGYSHDNRIDHNTFRDITSPSALVRIPIQIGQYATRHAADVTRSLIDYNVFKNIEANGVNSKSNNETYINNVFINFAKGTALGLRAGNNKVVRGNYFENVRVGLSISGENHIITNNVFSGISENGIRISAWGTFGDAVNGSTGKISILHNTIWDSASAGIEIGRPWGNKGDTNIADSPPFEINIVNNIIAGTSGTLLEIISVTSKYIDNNIFHASGTAKIGTAGASAISSDPRLDAYLRPSVTSPAVGRALLLNNVTTDYYEKQRGTARDIGAIETQ